MAPTDDRTTLVTGFGPFGDHDYNPSGDAAVALADRLVQGSRSHLLDVTYTTATQFAPAHIETTGRAPLRFIHLGLGAQREHVCFERVAVNRRSSRPDRLERNHGTELPGEQPLVDENRDRRTTSIDLKSLVDDYTSLMATALPKAKISDDCGRFVCNAIYYHSLRACQRCRLAGRSAQAVFIHIPILDSDRAHRLGTALGELFRH